jgi:glucokinase
MPDVRNTFDLSHLSDLSDRAGVTVGMDWGGTNIRAGLVSFDGRTARIRAADRLPWIAGTGPEDAVRKIAQLVADLKTRAGADEIHGLGIGLASMVNPKTGRVMNTPNLGWTLDNDSPLDLARMLSDAAGLPVTLHNDLSAIAWGERCFGAGRGADHMLCVFLGTGLGAAHVASGRLAEGAGGVAVELGHLRLRPGGELCGCGRRGCVEAYVGGRHIRERLAAELKPDGPGAGSQVLELAGGAPGAAHPGHADRAAQNGDPYASSLWDEISGLLAAALAFGVTLLDPGLLVMGGTVWTGCPELQRRTRKRLYELANPPALRHLQMKEAELGDQAGVLGAAALAMAVP